MRIVEVPALVAALSGPRPSRLAAALADASLSERSAISYNVPVTSIAAASLLRSSARAYASAALHVLEQQHPELLADGLPSTFAAPLDDLEVRVLHLAESVGVDRPVLLEHMVSWYKVAFHHRGVDPEYLPASLRAIETALAGELPAEAAASCRRHLAQASAHWRRAPFELPTELSRTLPHGEQAMRFLLAILERRGDDAVQLVRTLLAQGASVEAIHDHVLTPVQREVGRMWLMGEIPVADEHYGSNVVDRVLWLIHERMPTPAADAPVVLALGVGGNLHSIGLRLVAQRMQLGGFQVQQLGANMPADDLAWALADRRVDLVALSATLVLHVHAAASTVAHLRLAQQQVALPAPILVGGEPFRIVPDLHTLIGADAAAHDAASAVAAARRLVFGDP